MCNRISLLILSSVFLFAPIDVQAEELKLGYVDLQKALNDSEAGKQAKEQFKAEVDRAEQTLEKRKSEVEKLKEELEKKGLLLNDEQRDALERDYRDKLTDFERVYKNMQQELQIKDRQLTGRILEGLREVVQSVGEQGSYTVILEGNNTVVLYGAKAIDLTETIIKAYNQKGTKVSQSPAPAKAAAN
ncbi:MAG: OmpH family outer membrane protein [Deltaproteobacteria bacterium]|nr:OmpH family outer membrane protein [Deltaproteobacteria bacterium]